VVTPRDLRAWIEVCLSGQVSGMSVALVDGGRRWILAATPTPNDLSVALVEITGLQEAASEPDGVRTSAKAASRAMSMFPTNMRHGPHTPLNTILGFAEPVRDGPPTDPAGSAVRLVDLTCDRDSHSGDPGGRDPGAYRDDPVALAAVRAARLRLYPNLSRLRGGRGAAYSAVWAPIGWIGSTFLAR